MNISYTALQQNLESVEDTPMISKKDTRYKLAEEVLKGMNKDHQERLEKEENWWASGHSNATSTQPGKSTNHQTNF